MLNNPQTSSTALSLFMAMLLQVFQREDARATLDSRIAEDVGFPVRSMLITPRLPAGVDAPSTYVGQAGDTTVVLFNGVENAPQALQLTLGYYKGGVVGFGTQGHNQFLETWAGSLNAAIASGGFRTFTNIVVGGYSAGGAEAFVWANTLDNSQPGRRVTIFTYGGCKAGTPTLCRSFMNKPVVRYMNGADPVPNFPFPPTPNNIGQLLLPLVLSSVPLDFTHPPGGVALYPDGTTQNVDLVPYQSSVPLNFAGWLISGSQTPGGPHAIQTYIDRLTILDTLSNSGGAGGEWGSDEVTTPPDLSPRVMAQLTRQAESAAFAAGAGQQRSDVIIPPTQAFSTAKIGRVWTVTFGGEVVTMAPTKKRSRALARVGNDFLRRLQEQGVVDPATILVLFNQYFLAATDPVGGFNPPMRVTT